VQKKFISFNRLTGSARVYRSMLVAELAKHNLLNEGYVSYSDTCPDHGHYSKTVLDSVTKFGVDPEYAQETIKQLDKINFPLRIDYHDRDEIPNHSMVLSAVPECMASFVYVVTETCFWEKKKHLTEKIFKPIILKQPFMLVGCAHNLAYLKSYGFKTFERWIDESYDDIEDPVLRLQAVVKELDSLSALSNEQLTNMLHEMEEVLEYNFNLFNSKEFLDHAWEELKSNLTAAIAACPS
jgi:hypothetical protein